MCCLNKIQNKTTNKPAETIYKGRMFKGVPLNDESICMLFRIILANNQC